jgi:hypothetical protein
LICLLTAVGLIPGGSSTVHIYTPTIHRTMQLTTLNTISNFDTQPYYQPGNILTKIFVLSCEHEVLKWSPLTFSSDFASIMYNFPSGAECWFPPTPQYFLEYEVENVSFNIATHMWCHSLFLSFFGIHFWNILTLTIWNSYLKYFEIYQLFVWGSFTVSVNNHLVIFNVFGSVHLCTVQ